MMEVQLISSGPRISHFPQGEWCLEANTVCEEAEASSEVAGCVQIEMGQTGIGLPAWIWGGPGPVSHFYLPLAGCRWPQGA